MGFIAPAFLFFTLFIIVPTIASVYYSFTSWDGLNPVVKFVGLANYKEIFTSARFGNALKNTVILTAFISILENSMALILALIVDNVRWGKNFFRSAFYVPVLISGIVSVLQRIAQGAGGGGGYRRRVTASAFQGNHTASDLRCIYHQSDTFPDQRSEGVRSDLRHDGRRSRIYDRDHRVPAV